MIDELRMRGLGVIDEATLLLDPGLTVLTGETGAGKTMVLTGLAMARGAKVDAGSVRTGASQASVDSVWRLPPDSPLRQRLDEAGIDLDPTGSEDDAPLLILSRVLAEGGRSRAYAGGRTVPAALLGELTDGLVAVHGQADQLLLREPRRQRELLDLYAGDEAAQVSAEYRLALADWRATSAALTDLVDHRQDRDREAALLRHGIDEIAAVQPEPGEDEALKARAGVLSHRTELVEAVSLAHAALEADERSVAVLLQEAHRALERAGALDPEVAELAGQLDNLADAASAVASELAAHALELDVDPARLEEVENRRQALSHLKRRYGPELDDVLAWWRAAEEKVAAADDTDARIESLTEDERRLRATVVTVAERLSEVRRVAAEQFSRAVTAELRDLAMTDARVVTEVSSTDDVSDFTESGRDSVALLLEPHPGADPRPLGAGASGGELSRLMLAIEVILAGRTGIPTLVFDEVDAGIGGRVAVEVGRRLARLARSTQVIVVTHLPQVAAFADRHIVVTKATDGQVTSASVASVEGEERVRELVRMLSGLEDSAAGAVHAEELLALAAEDRGP